MLASVMIFLSALIIAVLGLIHLVYTFSGSKLVPRSVNVRVAMEAESPGITTETTMWKAWVGFNASHSIGAILFGLIYGFLAFAHPDLLFGSVYLSAVGLATLAALLFLAKRYWFSIPFRGIAASLLIYIVGQFVARL